jgi:hypothetical protein
LYVIRVRQKVTFIAIQVLLGAACKNAADPCYCIIQAKEAKKQNPTMPSTYTKTKRTKRPDSRPNGKRRLKESQKQVEKDRLERVAKNEAKGKIFAVERHAKLRKVDDVEQELTRKRGRQSLQEKKDPNELRVRALHKVLRQIQILEEKEKAGATLDYAQKMKVARFEEVISELEELQNVEDSDSDEDEEEEEEEEEESDDDDDDDE